MGGVFNQFDRESHRRGRVPCRVVRDRVSYMRAHTHSLTTRLLYEAMRGVTCPVVRRVDLGTWVADELLIALQKPAGQ